AVADVAHDRAKAGSLGRPNLLPVDLGIEADVDRDRFARRQEAADEMGTDEPSAAGDQDRHDRFATVHTGGRFLGISMLEKSAVFRMGAVLAHSAMRRTPSSSGV